MTNSGALRLKKAFGEALLATAAALAFAPAAQAQNWGGAVDSDWFDANNWSPATLPTALSSAYVDTLTTHPSSMRQRRRHTLLP